MKRFLVCVFVIMISVTGICFAEGEWVCPSCGTQNAHAFCGNCGAACPDWTCPSCGTANKQNFCVSCGKKNPSITPAPTPKPTAAPTPTPKPAGSMVAGRHEKEPKKVPLYFAGIQAYEVNVLDYVSDLDDAIQWSTEAINFGSTNGIYTQLKGVINNCYGISAVMELTEKRNLPDSVGFKIGLLNGKKGDYGSYHNSVKLNVGESGTLKCFNRTTKDFNGFTNMTSHVVTGHYFYYDYQYSGLSLYFADLQSAKRYIASIR